MSKKLFGGGKKKVETPTEPTGPQVSALDPAAIEKAKRKRGVKPMTEPSNVLMNRMRGFNPGTILSSKLGA